MCSERVVPGEGELCSPGSKRKPITLAVRWVLKGDWQTWGQDRIQPATLWLSPVLPYFPGVLIWFWDRPAHEVVPLLG